MTFSAHEPGTHLPGHRGVTKGMVTCHLGLTIPADTAKYTISVEGKSCTWSPGRLFAFDDTRHHDVWNYTDEDRVILLLHVRRPMRLPGALLQNACLVLIRASPSVQGAKRFSERAYRPRRRRRHQVNSTGQWQLLTVSGTVVRQSQNGVGQVMCRPFNRAVLMTRFGSCGLVPTQG